jgi:hypothetical protein
MKTIQLCTPLFLMFAIACDDMNASIDASDNANTQRAGEEADSSQGVRAGYLVKVARAIEAVNQNSPASLDHAGLNCETVAISSLEDVDSDCADMPEVGYTVDLANCLMEGGDTFDATMIVSATDIESSPHVLQSSNEDAAVVLRAFGDWRTDLSIDGGSGSYVSACGIITRSPARTILDYTMDIEDAEGASAKYDVLTRKSNQSQRRAVAQTRIDLVEADNLETEIQAMNIWTRQARAGQLLPQSGRADIEGPGINFVMFRRNLSGNSSAQYRSSFRQSDVVEIPTL